MTDFKLNDVQLADMSQEEMATIDGGGIIADAVYAVGYGVGSVLGWFSENAPPDGWIQA
jgi:hypothetical protein